MTSAEVIKTFDRYVIANYTRYPVCLTRGEGSYVWDAEGNRYLDLFPGWGCGLLGHCPPRVVKAVQEQVAELIHVPNTWYTQAQGLLAKALSERTNFDGRAFFCNSGTEANEAAIKLARLNGKGTGSNGSDRYKIVTMLNSFHGRTMGALSATAQPKYHQGVSPMLPGFIYVPFGDLDAVSKAIDGETIAILVEPIQGEGGINLPPLGLLARPSRTVRPLSPAADARRSADRHGPHRQVVHASALECEAGHAHARESRRWGHCPRRLASPSGSRGETEARHACRHLRRQSDRMPGGARRRLRPLKPMACSSEQTTSAK